MVRTPCFHAEGLGFVPGQGTSISQDYIIFSKHHRFHLYFLYYPVLRDFLNFHIEDLLIFRLCCKFLVSLCCLSENMVCISVFRIYWGFFFSNLTSSEFMKWKFSSSLRIRYNHFFRIELNEYPLALQFWLCCLHHLFPYLFLFTCLRMGEINLSFLSCFYFFLYFRFLNLLP